MWGRIETDKGSAPARVQDATPHAGPAGRQENGSLPPGMGEQRKAAGRVARFHDALKKLPDAGWGAFKSQRPREVPSSSSEDPEAWPQCSALDPAVPRLDAPRRWLCAPRRKALQVGGGRQRALGSLAGFCCHLAAVVRSMRTLRAAGVCHVRGWFGGPCPAALSFSARVFTTLLPPGQPPFPLEVCDGLRPVMPKSTILRG
ncbi:PREDICTED: uncharacterized protein LOC105590584 [Cercocebus atys]|uniref:uncharacterized protein LOC105590584 n=1 Tax=Cercocebus atys TaxID=9531 RepID=UPI0005F494D3|nr:PREDICTED: uncharacterized protein LOC105590584 [Cercocebus atys]